MYRATSSLCSVNQFLIAPDIPLRNDQLSPSNEPPDALINRLIDDVLISIFTHCLPPGSVSEPTYPDVTNTSVAPCTISHVSRRWRSLALRSSELWQSIKIDLKKPLDDTCLRTWVGRAGNRQLYVDLFQHKPSYADEFDDAGRARSIVFDILSAIPLDKLQHLGIQGIESMTPSSIANLLRKCPQIQSLTIFDPWDVLFDHHCPGPVSIQLGSLRTLATNVGLRSFGNNREQDIIQFINAPHLVDLTVEMTRKTMVKDMLPSIFQATHLSKDFIVSFRLVYVWPPTSQQVQTLLHHFVNTERLVLVEASESEAKWHQPFLDAELFDRLNLDSQEPLAPCLKILSVDDLAGYPMTPEACEKALAFMKSRAGKGLEFVRMALEAPRPDDVKVELGVLGKHIDVSNVTVWLS